MRKKYSKFSNKLKFYIGDIRDLSSIDEACYGVDYIFHAAALKQVPSCEFFPMEAVKTNILGTNNVLDAAKKNGVAHVVCLSTDKAVYPINAMGISKSLMEKVALAKSRDSGNTIISITRYGNVIASRGSVIPLFFNQIKTQRKITITDPGMTRFIMSLDEAVDLVLHAFKNAQSGDIFVQKSPSARIDTIYEAVIELLNKPKYPFEIIGTRHGEKRFETLLSKEENIRADKTDNRYFKVPLDSRDLDYTEYFESGNEEIINTEEYNSDNTEILSTKELVRELNTNFQIKRLIERL